MASAHRIPVLLAILLLGSACKTPDPSFCEGAPHNNCMFEAGIPAPCILECSGDTPVCDSSRGKCVQCTTAEHEECSGTMPVCRDNMCRRCTTHEECDSRACLPDGSCESETNVAYVDPDGTDNPMCTRAMPCKLVSLALATTLPYVKFTGTTNEAVTVDNGRIVTFLAEPDSTLTRTSGVGPIVTVSGNGTSLTVYDLSISGASNPSGIGMLVPAGAGDPMVTLARARVMNNKGSGISTSGGTLTVLQSEISGNAGGGIIILSGQFDLTNNFIAGNGGSNTFGGVRFDAANAGIRRFEFNTVANNNSMGSVASGVACTAVTQHVTFSNNIIYSNQRMDFRTQVSNTASGANCSWTYSDIGPEPPVAGMGNGNNINIDPRFIDLTHNNLHLDSGSPARDVADGNATLAVDFDGQGRPQGIGRDIGADEAP